MAERLIIETYGRAPHNRNIWPHKSRASPSRLADSFVLQLVVYPLLECERRIGEIKSSVGRMCKLTEVFWESVPKSWCRRSWMPGPTRFLDAHQLKKYFSVTNSCRKFLTTVF